ncbi:MAG: hypothetical protein IPO07_14745 [Haliscomenobacter sp.]|nr:hypothetical protein [Haliscomenobacter sp.]MBK9489884.1 hypothetical protein [Haliscomenobacter sp.]
MQREWVQEVNQLQRQNANAQSLDKYAELVLEQYQRWLNKTWNSPEIQTLPSRSAASLYGLFQYINDRAVDLRKN